MTIRLPTGLDQLPLHEHQKDAVRKTIQYLRTRDPDHGTCALIQMPTGSGKTGIIAVLSRLCPGINRTLVLAPRIAIRDQLIREIKSDFFKKVGISARTRTVAELSQKHAAESEPAVLIATVHLIDRWRKENPTAYQLLRSNLDLVVMDEGHYEPASSWSKTIRDLGKPVALVTATPYRNDLKAFRISTEGVSTLRFSDAVARGIVRNVVVSQRGSITDPTAFCEDTLSAFNSLVPKGEQSGAKIIIRCEDAARIRQLCGAFRTKGVSVVGIHERFGTGSQPWLRKSVPAPGTESAQVWIHQFKLLEGVDDPAFRIVGFFGPTMNVRALVQQVGRVIRNPSGKTGQKAFLLDHHNGALDHMWSQYLKYDRDVTPEDMCNSLATKITKLLRTGFSGLQYFDKEFKMPFTFDNVTAPLKEFMLPREAHILRTVGASASSISAWISDQLQEGDCESRAYNSGDPNRLIYAYTRASSSRLVKGMYFLETRLGLIVATLHDEALTFFDSGGMLPINADEAGIYGAPAQSNLSKVIRVGQKSRVSEISTRNSSISRGTVRTRSTSAPSLEDLSPYLDDFQHVVTALTGYSDEGSHAPIRRYIGYTRGRVSQPGKPISLGDYFKWTDEIVARMGGTRARTYPLLSRYSKELSNPPANTSPKNVLIDFTEATKQFTFLSDDPTENGQPLEVEDACVDCTPHPSIAGMWTCSLSANSKPISIDISYDSKRRRYQLTSQELDDSYSRDDGRSEGLISWLNRHQAFNVIPGSSKALYVHGSFYDPDIPTGTKFNETNFVLANVLHPIPAFAVIRSEKGAHCQAGGIGWEIGCLFERIDAITTGTSELSPFLEDPTVVVCDDLNKEACDFFLANRDKVVMAHAKATSSYRPLSASALQEVVSQAIKNASYLSMLNRRTPPNLANWSNIWRTGGTPTGEVLNRVRLGGPAPAAAWELFANKVRDPNSSREVWLVLGGMLSQSVLYAELRKRNPAPQALQATHLLLSCLAAISATGSRLRVFCSP